MKQQRTILGSLIVVMMLAFVVLGCQNPITHYSAATEPTTRLPAYEGEAAITLLAITGVVAPVQDAVPVTTPIDTDQYTGTVAWSRTPARFAAGAVYTATITLTAKTGWTLTGVAANSFTVAGATAKNAVNAGTVAAVFPATTSVSVGDSWATGKVAYILQNGDPGYVAGEQHGLIIAGNDQVWSAVYWAPLAYRSSMVVYEATRWEIGTGLANTNAIIAVQGPGTGYAAGLAKTNICNSEYTNWCLPSKDELSKIYLNRALLNVGMQPDNGGNENLYWSSTDAGGDQAWAQKFRSGYDDPPYALGKGGTAHVRSVRTF